MLKLEAGSPCLQELLTYKDRPGCDGYGIALVNPRHLLLARPGPAEVLTIRQLSGGKRTDLKRAALSRFVRTRLDIEGCWLGLGLRLRSSRG